LDESRLDELEARRAELHGKYLRPVAERVSPGRGIHHAALICSDVETTIRFYQDVLGFPLVELVENRDYKGSSHFFFDLGNKTLLGFFDFPGLGLEPVVEAIGGVQHIAISCPRDRWEECQRRLDEAGVKYAGPDLGIPESMYFKDPDGIQIELLSDPLMYFGGAQLDE
jgi:glyoxylase I family protein